MTVSIGPRHDFIYAGARVAVYHAKTGEGIPRHSHSYPHGTIVHAGSLLVRKEGIEVVVTPETGCVSLRAGEWHELEARQDGTVFANIFQAGAT